MQNLVTHARHLEILRELKKKLEIVLEIRPEKTSLAVVACGRIFYIFNFLGDEVESFEVKLTQI